MSGPGSISPPAGAQVVQDMQDLGWMMPADVKTTGGKSAMVRACPFLAKGGGEVGVENLAAPAIAPCSWYVMARVCYIQFNTYI